MKRIIGVLTEPRRIHEYVAYVRFVAESVAADPIFRSRRPPITVLRGDVAALGAATVASLSKEAGKKSARKALALRVHDERVTLECYVRGVAHEHPGEEASIIARAGMTAKNARGPSKLPFEAKQLPLSGAVHLFACAAKGRASYDWQCAKGEEPWLFGPRTVQADGTLYGLVRGAVYFFRYRTVTREGASDWSQVVSPSVV